MYLKCRFSFLRLTHQTWYFGPRNEFECSLAFVLRDKVPLSCQLTTLPIVSRNKQCAYGEPPNFDLPKRRLQMRWYEDFVFAKLHKSETKVNIYGQPQKAVKLYFNVVFFLLLGWKLRMTRKLCRSMFAQAYYSGYRQINTDHWTYCYNLDSRSTQRVDANLCTVESRFK